MRRFIVYPDAQVPYHDQKAIDLITAFAKQLEVTDVLHVGDEVDCPQPSRWVRGRAGETAMTLQKDIDAAKRMLAGITDELQPDSFMLSRSNHGDRVRKYLDEKAPALAPLRALEWATLMDFEELGITYVTKPTEFAKDWVLCHGDEGSMSRIPAATALNLAKKWGGVSVVAGHTHRLGLMHENHALNGKIRKHCFGIEVGHTMRLDRASYLQAFAANWQQGCAILEEDDRGVITPYVIPIIGGKIRFQGEVFSA